LRGRLDGTKDAKCYHAGSGACRDIPEASALLF
jgi:hypothetical protein